MNKDPKTLEYARLPTSADNVLRWRRALAIFAILSLPVAVLSVVAIAAGAYRHAGPEWVLFGAFGVFLLAAVGSLIAVMSIVWIGAIRKRGGRLTELEKTGIAVGLITITGSFCCLADELFF